jgi:hypothetical protein
LGLWLKSYYGRKRATVLSLLDRTDCSYFAEDLEWLFDARENSTGPPEQGIIMEKNPGNSGKVPCVMINLPGSVSNIRTTKMLHFYSS